jgi:hypothetical protein
MIIIITNDTVKEATISSSVDEGTQTLSDLWQSIADIANGCVADNAKSETYPLHVREQQLASLEVLINALDMTHRKVREAIAEEYFPSK